MDSTHQKLGRLQAALKALGRAAVAFSGGVDSSFLLKSAQDVLGDSVLAITASFHSFPSRDLKEAQVFTQEYGIAHTVFELDDLSIKGFTQNPPDRCYLCKREILGQITRIARANGFEHVLEGSNADDDGDYRPGARAVRELGALSPLCDAGLTKAEIRSLSKEMGLATWNKPACACLASRFAYGEEITLKKIGMVERAEEYLHNLGFSQVRVRVHGNLARVEVVPDEMERFVQPENMADIGRKLKELGFSYAALDLAGYRMGSMNEALCKSGV